MSTLTLRDWQLVTAFRWFVLMGGTTTTVLADLHPGPGWRIALAVAVTVAISSTIGSRPRFAGQGRLMVLAGLELAAAIALIASNDGSAPAYALFAASPLLTIAVLGSYQHLAVFTVAAVVGVDAITFLHVGGGIFAALHASAVVIAIPWLVIFARQPPTTRNARLLTDADGKLLDLLERGLTYAQIAESTGVSSETVKVRVARLYRRLGVGSRHEAVEVRRQ
jgi:DNA-binding NarL/FixJ family response regulator